MSTRASAGLTLDRYHLDSAYVCWKTGRDEVATFDLTARTLPFAGGYLLVAGIEPALEFITGFTFSSQDLSYIRSEFGYERGFLDALAAHRFTGEVAAMREGTIAFAGEPILRVTAPLREALLLESGLMRIINLSSLVATKAARCVEAAQGRPVADFSLRRAHDPAMATRAAWIGGVASTSYVDAGRRLQIPTSGTIPHALVQAYPDEHAAFEAVASSLERYTLLLDTYDVERAARTAVEVARAAPAGHELVAVRLDSGDLGDQAKRVRAILDDAGFEGVRILASGDLDEFAIDELLRAGAPIDAFGVGTKLGVGMGSIEHALPGGALNLVYKLAVIGDRPVIKTAPGKETWPGRKQVIRFGRLERDLIALDAEPVPDGGRRLLAPAIEGGEQVGEVPDLEDARSRARHELASLPAAYRRLRGAEAFPIEQSHALQRLREVAEASS